MKSKNIINILLIVVISITFCSNIILYHNYIKVNKCLNTYHQYEKATEALLDDIDKDISLEDTYLCGDVGDNYYNAIIQLDSLKK